MKKYLVTASIAETKVKNTIVFHTANTESELLNNFKDFYKNRAWEKREESFTGPHIEMEIHDGNFVRHHNSEKEPKLHIHNTQNNKHPHTLCFTLPIRTQEDALKKLKSWMMWSLYTLLHNEDFGYKYAECSENDDQFTGLMEEKFGISYAIEEIPN